MSKDDTKITLGSGDLFINNVDVGHLKGEVSFVMSGETLDFKPANTTAPVAKFVIKESAELSAKLAEIKSLGMAYALGFMTQRKTATTFPSYDPTSFSTTTVTRWDINRFGGDRTVSQFSLRFEHIKPVDGNKIIIVLYQVVSNRNLALAFQEEDFSLQDITFTAMADANRVAGDQIGFIVEQQTVA